MDRTRPALSHTSHATDRETRLRTAGHVIDEMQVRLLDPETGLDVDPGVSEGVPACKGPAMALGYWGDDAANAKLFTDDGWMLMGDIVRIDGDGVLTVIGRTSDFIIRGGKNISAPAVEAELATHPGVAMVAAVAFPDPVFGERVCAYIELRPGATIELADLVEHLRARSVSREWWPEHLVVMDSLPRSSGGKVAKGELKADAARRSAELHAEGE
jgi:acyl-CoA synthetase